MSNLSYWEKRFLQTKASQLKSTEAYERALQPQLKGLQHELDIEMNKYYRRYSQTNDISEEQTRKILNNIGNSNWKMTLDQFKQKAIEGGHQNELDSEYFKSRISRLKNLESQLKQRTGSFAKNQQASMKGALAKQYGESYMRTIFNSQSAHFSFSGNFAHLNDNQLKTIISKPWKGSDFSKRIWNNYHDELPDKLMDSILRGSLMGYHPSKISRMMHAKFQDVSKKDIHRLVTTEFGHINEEATAKGYEESGIDQYQYMATLESHTCMVCAHLDGQIFNLSDRKDGINYPTIHPYCRCTTVPYIEDLPEVGERWMRDPETGEGKLTDNISFKDWKKKYCHKVAESGSIYREGSNTVDLNKLNSFEFRSRFRRLTDNSRINGTLRSLASGMLTKHTGTDTEDLFIINAETGNILVQKHGSRDELTPGILTNEENAILMENRGNTIAIHNHPTNVPLDGSDYAAAAVRGYKKAIIVTHAGDVYSYGVSEGIDIAKARLIQNSIDRKIARIMKNDYTNSVEDSFIQSINSVKEAFGLWYEKELVEKIFQESLKQPKHGGVNQFGGYDLSDEEWDYLDTIADDYDYSKETMPIYEH